MRLRYLVSNSARRLPVSNASSLLPTRKSLLTSSLTSSYSTCSRGQFQAFNSLQRRCFSTSKNDANDKDNKSIDGKQQITEDRAIFEKEQSILHSFTSLFSAKPKFNPPADVTIVPTVPIRMKHGLIQKYHFDLMEFVSGVKQAYPAIRQAFADKEKALLEGNHNTKSVEEADELLSSVLHPYFYALYNSGAGVNKPGSNSMGNAMIQIAIGDKKGGKVDLKDPNAKPVVETTQLEHTTIGDLDVHLVDEEYYEQERAAYEKLVKGMSKLIDESAILNEDEKQKRKQMLENLEMARLYPEGSVVLSVEAFFLFEDYFHLDVEGKDGQTESQKFKRLIGERAFFRSCLSGQVPMDWRLTMMEVLHNVTVKAD